MASILLTYVFSEDSCPVLVAQFGCILFALWKGYEYWKQKRTEDEMSQVGLLPPSKPGEHSVETSSKSMVIQERQHSGENQQLERYPDNKACGDNTNNPPEERPKLRVCSLRHVLELSALGMPFIVKKSYRELQDDLKATRTGGIKCQSMGEDEAATSHREIRFGLTRHGSLEDRAIQTIEENLKQRIAKYNDSINRDSEDHHQTSEQKDDKNNTISKLKMCMLRHILEKSILDVPHVVRTSWQTHSRPRSGCPKDLKQIFFFPLQSNSKTCQETGPSASTNKPKNVLFCPPEMCKIICMASGDFTSQGPQTIHTLHHQSSNPNVKSLHPSIPRYLKKVTKHYFKRSQRPSRKDYNVLTFALSKILFSHSNVEGPRIVKNPTPNLRMQRGIFLATHFRPRPVMERVNEEEAKDLSKEEPQLFEETERPSDEGPTSYSPKTTKPMKTCPGGRFNDVKCKPCSSGVHRDKPRGTIREIFRQLVHFPCEDEFGTCFCLPQGIINQI